MRMRARMMVRFLPIGCGSVYQGLLGALRCIRFGQKWSASRFAVELISPEEKSIDTG